MKKLLKIFGAIIGLLLVVLIAIPFLFEGKILEVVKSTVNKNITADFDFEDADISLIRSFPELNVEVNNMRIINTDVFAGDTLVAAKNATVNLPFFTLFNSAAEPYVINSFRIDGAVVNVFVNEEGKVNYDIAKKTTEPTASTAEDAPSEVALSIQQYDITNSKIKYHDSQSKMFFELADLNHSGTGDLSAIISELDTKTSGLISLDMDGTNYFTKTPIGLDAKLGIDLEQNTYTFLENTAVINQLKLVFDGFVTLKDNSQEVALTFKTPSSDFKNFLALIPKAYSKDIDQVQTTGDFVVEGQLKGVVDDTHIPTFNIGITSHNASFKYPDLPQSVSQITIDTKIANETGILDDTYVTVNALTFKIAQDVFSANATIKNLMGNPQVDARLKGRINLGNLAQAYPFSVEQRMQGILDANLSTMFDMKAIESGRYQDTKNSGSLALNDFEFDFDSMQHPLQISEANLTFNTENVTLNALEAKTGQTDLSVKGSIANLLGYMFNDEILKGQFTLNSNTFAVNDFMSEHENEETENKAESGTSKPAEAKSDAVATEAFKIPAFLDATFVAQANTVLYDDLALKNASATLHIKDETVSLNDFKTDIFNGQIALNGAVSTKTNTPDFDVKLNMQSLNLADAFNGLDMLQMVAPLARAFEGVLNSGFEINGQLNTDLTPNLNTISGNALAEVLVNEVTAQESKVLSVLTNRLEFLNFDEGETKTLKTALTFQDGQVNVKPFNLKFDDIAVNISGSHGFDQSLNYKATFDVPAKYLGDEAQKLLATLNNAEAKNLTVPVTANIGGRVNSPTINTDLSATATQLTNKLVAMQKDKLINEGSNTVKNALNNFINGNNSKDTSAIGTDAIKKKDSVTTDQIKKAADNLLNGLFGKKKSSTSTGD
ncbi:AsmA family protein [Formosa sp. A9]|uniref:AsmA family protein n=1 Tax=Formosa sp. A9 TaxID=3442641 RepID=UPI003EBDFE24